MQLAVGAGTVEHIQSVENSHFEEGIQVALEVDNILDLDKP